MTALILIMFLSTSRALYKASKSLHSLHTRSSSALRFSTLNVVLDLDECMVHSTFLDGDEAYRQFEESRLNKKDKKDDRLTKLDVQCEDGAPVSVALRPNLIPFLKALHSQNYNVYAFTAALPIYARPVFARLEEEVFNGEGNFLWKDIWYRHHCSAIPVRDTRSGREFHIYGKDIIRYCLLSNLKMCQKW